MESNVFTSIIGEMSVVGEMSLGRLNDVVSAAFSADVR